MTSVRLYHYTGHDHVDGIRRDGITRGSVYVPWATGYRVVHGVQWLTDSDDWSGQGWATQIVLRNHDRTSVRYSVVIPKSARPNLHRWNDYARVVLRVPEHHLRAFNQAGGSDGSRWYVYVGRIPCGWLRAIDERPTIATFDSVAECVRPSTC